MKVIIFQHDIILLNILYHIYKITATTTIIRFFTTEAKYLQ